MAELQQQTLNNVTLTTYVANADQIVRFVNGSMEEIRDGMPDVNKLGISYVSTEDEKKIALLYDGTEIGGLDASEFVKDGMVSSVSYDEESRALTIKWNADAGRPDEKIGLSGLADSRVFIDDRISGVSGQSDLSVVKLGSEEYASMLSAGTVLSNCLYVVENRFADMYGQQAKNMAAGTDLSDAVTLGQLGDGLSDMSAYVDGSCETLSSELTGWVEGRGYLVPEDVGISYDSASKNILLASKGNVTSVDCADFIKDGMLSTAELCGTVLVMTFNTTAGSEPISVELSDFVDDYGPDIEYLSGRIDEVDGAKLSHAEAEELSSKLAGKLTGWVENQGYLTEHQDINGKANKDEMDISASADKAVITLHTGLSVSVVTEHQSLSSKRDLSDLVYTKTGEADAYDKWIVDGPLENFSRIILSPSDSPEGELVWAWSNGDLGPVGSKYVRLVWNEDESQWTMTAGQSTITDISETVTGEWDDKSLQFIDDNDRTWTAKRYAVADTLALSGEVKQWVENQEYLTEHQSLSNYYAKSETSSAAEISEALAGKQPVGDYATSAYVNEGHGYSFQEHFNVADQGAGGKVVSLSGVALESDVYLKGVFDECLSAVRQYDSPEKVPLSAVVNAIWCLSRLQARVAEEG